MIIYRNYNTKVNTAHIYHYINVKNAIIKYFYVKNIFIVVLYFSYNLYFYHKKTPRKGLSVIFL